MRFKEHQQVNNINGTHNNVKFKNMYLENINDRTE